MLVITAMKMLSPLVLFAALWFGGIHSPSSRGGSSSTCSTNSTESRGDLLGRCQGTMKEADGIVSFLQEEYSSNHAKTYVITGATR